MISISKEMIHIKHGRIKIKRNSTSGKRAIGHPRLETYQRINKETIILEIGAIVERKQTN